MTTPIPLTPKPRLTKVDFHKVHEELAMLNLQGVSLLCTGSTWINGEGNDLDVVIGPIAGEFTVPEMHLIHDVIVKAGYIENFGYDAFPAVPGWRGYRMACYRKGDTNLIFVDRGVDKWKQARDILTMLAMVAPVTKRHRAMLHRVLVDGVTDVEDAAIRVLTSIQEDYV